MDARKEALTLLEKIWAKLQGLPAASPLEIGAFLILLLFILVVILMLLLTCFSFCCCCRKTAPKEPTSKRPDR